MALVPHPVLALSTAADALTQDNADAPSLMLASRVIELLPIPAAMLSLQDIGIAVIAVNRAYEMAGLGIGDRRRSLVGQIEGRIEAFIRGDSLRADRKSVV